MGIFINPNCKLHNVKASYFLLGMVKKTLITRIYLRYFAKKCADIKKEIFLYCIFSSSFKKDTFGVGHEILNQLLKKIINYSF